MAVPRRLVQRHLAEHCRFAACRGSRTVSRRFYATEQKQDGESESFKGQLYQSTNERLQREREDQARFAQQREAEKARRGNGAWVIPMGTDAHRCMLEGV